MVNNTASDIQIELAKFSDIEVFENEEMWASRVIDEHSRKESGSVVVTEFTHQNNTTER
jgi:hypothetical protein